uniref:hypothetical protein n=1 Tax=Nonomuraea bangladeshensis TaxID=404385 RepID=UPI003F493290
MLFDLDLEVVPTGGELDTTIYASHTGYICVPGSGQCTQTCWNCHSVSRCCKRPV